MTPLAPVHTEIVLIGGGHAHVHVLSAFAKLPEPGVRLTLVTRDLETPYSGMLPGVVAGLYSVDEAHIAERAIAVKPIGLFLSKFNALLEECRGSDGPRRIAVIGGGAGGAELLLSVRSRLLKEMAGADFSFALVTDAEVLAQHNARVRETFRRAFAARGIALHEHRKARAVTAEGILTADGTTIAADAVLITTDAAPPPWFERTGLARDGGGFLAVDTTLQVLNDPDVFAAGDCAGLTASPRPKSGVFAVRAGPPLADNLRRRARKQPLMPWQPQRQHLALISTGERYAVASRGWMKAEGAWLWTVKDWIDRRWVRMYQDTDRMTARRG